MESSLVNGRSSAPSFIKGGLGGFPRRRCSYGKILTTGVLLIISILALAACYQPVPRDLVAEAGQDSTSTPEPAPTATSPPPPTATPPPTPTPTPQADPTSEPTTPPVDRTLFLNVDRPRFGSTTTTGTITIAGSTPPGTTLQVNGELVLVNADGSFQAQVSLVPGPNVIDVRATDLQGGQERESVLVTYNPPIPPNLELGIQEPRTLNLSVGTPYVRVSGHVNIPQALLTVNGVQVLVNDFGNFSTTVRGLQQGVNTIEVLALHPESIDLQRLVITVTYNPP